VQHGDHGARGKWLKHVPQQRENVERYRRETRMGVEKDRDRKKEFRLTKWEEIL
jgi:hypothetical protein